MSGNPLLNELGLTGFSVPVKLEDSQVRELLLLLHEDGAECSPGLFSSILRGRSDRSIISIEFLYRSDGWVIGFGHSPDTITQKELLERIKDYVMFCELKRKIKKGGVDVESVRRKTITQLRF